MLNEIDCQALVVESISRLPMYIQRPWKKIALDHKKKDGSYPDFAALVYFVSDVAAEVNDPVYGQINLKSTKTIKDDCQRTSRYTSAAFVTSTSKDTQNKSTRSLRGDQPSSVQGKSGRGWYAKSEPPSVLCRQSHRLWHCDRFKTMQPPQRLSIVNKHRLCHNCLLASHTNAYCDKKSPCSAEGCRQSIPCISILKMFRSTR